MIEIKQVSFSYSGDLSDAVVLHNIDLRIKPDEFIAFLGPNGSGKSSLSRLLNGIEQPTQGEITVDGRDTADAGSLPAIRRAVQIVFQNPENQQVGISVGEDIAFGLSNIGWPHQDMNKRIQWALDLVGLDVEYDRLVTQLSGGEKQKLALASVLALSPRYLILDEATSMLDPVARKEFIRTLHAARKEHSFALIYITHHLEEVLEADRLVLLRQGEVQAIGAPDDVLADERLLAECELELPYLRSLALSLRKQGFPVSLSPDLAELRSFL